MRLARLTGRRNRSELPGSSVAQVRLPSAHQIDAQAISLLQQTQHQGAKLLGRGLVRPVAALQGEAVQEIFECAQSYSRMVRHLRFSSFASKSVSSGALCPLPGCNR